MLSRDTWRRPALVLVSCLLVGLLVAQAGVAATSQAEPTAESAEAVAITVTNATIDDDGTKRLELTLTRAPEGLAGFQLTAVLASADVATITNASYPDRYGLTTDPAIAPDRQSVTLEAADLSEQITPGATDVPLATVTIAGAGNGQTQVEIADMQIDADGGERVDAAVEPGVVTVGKDTAASSEDSATTAGDATAAQRTEAESPAGAAGPSPIVLVGTLVAGVLLGLGVLARHEE